MAGVGKNLEADMCLSPQRARPKGAKLEARKIYCPNRSTRSQDPEYELQHAAIVDTRHASRLLGMTGSISRYSKSVRSYRLYKPKSDSRHNGGPCMNMALHPSFATYTPVAYYAKSVSLRLV